MVEERCRTKPCPAVVVAQHAVVGRVPVGDGDDGVEHEHVKGRLESLLRKSRIGVDHIHVPVVFGGKLIGDEGSVAVVQKRAG